ncbi:MAG: YigZ family protein [Bacteroidales bacterium]
MSEKITSDSYKSIAKQSKGVYKELGSKFLSFAYPVSSEEEIKRIISEIKKEFFDARHHCYAYRLGSAGELWRANDDGEPSSSAGRPILGQLLSNELSDILIVVVRYFGGTKLGVSGLIRAYKSAASDVIVNSEIVEKIVTVPLEVRFAYTNIEHVMKLLKNKGADIKRQDFGVDCSILLNVRKGDLQGLMKSLSDLPGVKTK